MVLFIFTQIIFIFLRKTPLISLWVQVLAFLIECTHITITSFLMRLTPPLLLIAKYTYTCNTRNANNYRPYFCRPNIKQFTLLHQGPKLWNSPPYNLMQLTSFSSFKTSLKKIPHQERYKLNSPDHDMTADTIS